MVSLLTLFGGADPQVAALPRTAELTLSQTFFARPRKEVCAPPGFDSALAKPEVFDQKIGAMWAHAMALINIPAEGCVVEVAPGSEPKVGIGLSRLGFKGTVYLIEPCAASLQAATKKYREVLPHAEVIPVLGTLAEASRLITHQVDALVANHPLDDMLIAHYMNGSDDFQNFFVSAYCTPHPEDRRLLWWHVDANPELLAKAKASVVREWTDAITHFAPSSVVISQYRSYYFTSNGIPSPDAHALEMLSSLRAVLSNDRTQELLEDPGTTEEPSRWLIAHG